MKILNLKYLGLLMLGLFMYSCDSSETGNDLQIPMLLENEENIKKMFGLEGLEESEAFSSSIRAKLEAIRIVKLGAREARRSVLDFNGIKRPFKDELNVFLPSAIDIDEPNLRDAKNANVTLPIYEGVGPSGGPTYFIITETTTPILAKIYGAILAPKLRYGALPNAAAAAQRVKVERNGRIIFRGDVDFSPERKLEAGSDNPHKVSALSLIQPGAIGDPEYSSLVVLPSGNVINAQIIANKTGIHDRINWIDIENRKVNLQLINGWEGGDEYYYHLVTDASDIGAATIELGVYAPRLQNLPVFDKSELDNETILLGFSPNGNELTLAGGTNPSYNTGVNSAVPDHDLDPANVFPFAPDNSDPNNNYSPLLNANISMWTDDTINGSKRDARRPITGFDDIHQVVDVGLVTSNIINPGFGVRATNAVINCPVILHPFQGGND